MNDLTGSYAAELIANKKAIKPLNPCGCLDRTSRLQPSYGRLP